ncbi:MAG: hypothetical protein QW279_14535 [Candidatus Jordarchaeaceae archaeon]
MSKNRVEGVYHLSGHEAPRELEGCYKIASIYLLLRFNLPTLDGIVVTEWNKSVAQYVFRFLQERGWKHVVIRTDKKNETGIYMRGGYLCSVEELESEVLYILGGAGLIKNAVFVTLF